MPPKKAQLKNIKAIKSTKQRFKDLPFSRLLPNITTLMSLCTGLSAVRFAMADRYELAVIAILIAAILDAMDGRLARMLGVDSHFGAELDSLSDFVSFGVAPALVLYVGSLHEWKGFGWAICLFFVICSALRLARFNTALLLKDELPDWKTRFFTGVPAPLGAFLALLPMMFVFALEESYSFMPYLYGLSLLGAGSLMVSKLPTYSSKGRHVSQGMVLPFMLGAGLCVTALINAFWFTLSIVGVLYLGSLYFSYKSYRRQETLGVEEDEE
jgi:CDP-diacylglycerol---serine O-phosphatidyltransferase